MWQPETAQLTVKISSWISPKVGAGGAAVSTVNVDTNVPPGLPSLSPSNTSPVLTLRFEADSAEELERIQDAFQAQLSAVDASLRFR